MNLKKFFNPKTIAVIGVSRNPNKVGHVIFKNILDGDFKGKVFPVNKKTKQILHHKVFSSISKIKHKIDLVIIAVPSKYVMKIMKQCNSKKIKDVLVISAGFKEVGKEKLETKLKEYVEKNKIRMIGTNCLGILDVHTKLDTIFIPKYRLKRPSKGSVSLICQSGAVGSALLDLASEKNHKFSKFISYGNATSIDESDLLDYLNNDTTTKVICMYLEGVKNGNKFYQTLKKMKKPVIVIKGGLTNEGSKAALSHTGTLAGDKEVYLGIFRQTKIILADTLEEMLDIASIIEKNVKFKGNRIQIITNGGGYGIISADNISISKNLKLAKPLAKTKTKLQKHLPSMIHIGNPLDLLGDATTESYKKALESYSSDKNIDIILLIILYQTPLITTDIVEVVSEFKEKPLVVVSTGAKFTENLSESLEINNIPTFSFPENAIRSIDKILDSSQ